MVHPFIEDLIRKGILTDEQANAWLEYNQSGGTLGPIAWVNAGMPSISEEQAADSWMARLGNYLMSQMEQGFKSEPEADVIWEDMNNRLTGQDKYAGERQTVADLSGPIVTAVKSYWTSLPVERQKAIDQEARESQQREENIASQWGGIPLNARGTPEQQIIAGQNAIRQLQIQRPASPNYLQKIIDAQINQLQEGISQLWETARSRARERGEAEEGVSAAGKLEQEAEAIRAEPGTIARDFAERYGISPEAAQQTGARYFENPESKEFANLTKDEESHLAWVGMAEEGGGGTPKEPIVTVEPPEFEKLGATGSPLWKRWFQQRYPTIAREFTAKPEEKRTAEGWSSFLEQERARIKEEFAKQSPYSRGERPGAFQPKIRTVAF